MTPEALRTAGIILVIYPTGVFGGVRSYGCGSPDAPPPTENNPLRQRLWTADHAHAGLLLILSLAVLLIVDQANLAASTRPPSTSGCSQKPNTQTATAKWATSISPAA